MYNLWRIPNKEKEEEEFKFQNRKSTASAAKTIDTSHTTIERSGKKGECEDSVMDAGFSGQVDEKPQIHDGFQNFTAEEIMKYQKYEAEYASRLRAKYFSNKDIYGGDIFDITVPIDDGIIKASRWSPTRSYADPKQSFLDHSNVLVSGSETTPVVPNGKTTTPKKSS